ncbi:MAG TPA: hypothetical protein VHP83_19820, partial [Aggregatilineaceae bacterium]|nr:hypothetical protein [Aggregatilineaceae bacterium]
LSAANGGELELVYTLAIIDMLEVTPAEVVGNAIAAHMHRAIQNYTVDPTAALDEFSAAIDLDAGNPIPYLYRALTYLRLENAEKMMVDMQTAARLAPDDWTMIAYLNETSDINALLVQYQQIADLRPDDWFIRFLLGTLYYETGDIAQATDQIQQSLDLGPYANMPHIIAILIALREGNIPRVQELAHIIITQFPDPGMTNRVFEAIYGTGEPSLTGTIYAAGTN